MSGECDKCGEHCLDCKCKIRKICHLPPKVIPLEQAGIEPPAQEIKTTWINVRGRAEHEAIIRDADKCKELGLDQMYEILVYLKRWGSWLDTPPDKPAA